MFLVYSHAAKIGIFLIRCSHQKRNPITSLLQTFAQPLPLVLGRGNTKLFLEYHREVTLGTEARHIRNLGYRMLTALLQLGSAVQLVGTEETAGRFACQTLYLIIEFGTRDIEHLGNTGYIEF